MQVAVSKVPVKKKSKVGWILLIIFLVLVVGPIALTYILFYDGATKNINVNNETDIKEIGNRLIVDSLDYAPTEKMIDVKVTDSDVDNLLRLAMKSIPSNVPFVKKAYVVVSDNRYFFYVDADAGIFKTRAKVTTTMEISPDNEKFVFKIKDISLGRVGGLLSVGKPFIEKYVTYEKIDQILAGTQTDLSFDREQYAIVYPKTSLLTDLGRLAGSESMGLYFDVMQTMVRDNMMEFKFRNNNVIEGIVDLEHLSTNDLVTDEPGTQIRIRPEQVQEKRDMLVSLIEHGDIDPSNDELLFDAFDYLFGGWESLNESQKNNLNPIDFTYVDIDDKEAYEGFGLYDAEAKLVDKMKDTVDAQKLVNKTLDPRYKELCTLDEGMINEYISSKNIVGYTSLLHRDTPQGYKVNYITIENFYMNIYKNSLDKNIAELVCKIDVNGYPTSLTFDTQMSDGGFTDNKLVFEVKNIKFGSSDASNLKEEFFDIISEALNNQGDDSLTMDAENYTISVDFTNIMDYACEQAENAVETYTGTHYDLETYFAISNLTFEIIGSSREDNGKMKLSLIEPINY